MNLFGVQQIFENKPANGWKVAERDVRVCVKFTNSAGVEGGRPFSWAH